MSALSGASTQRSPLRERRHPRARPAAFNPAHNLRAPRTHAERMIDMTTSTTALRNGVDLAAVADLTDAVRTDPAAASTVWRAEVTWQGGFQSSAQIRDFPALHSDEPRGLGGADSAPNPVEQLLAALGNCLAVGYAANASARGIELSDLRIAVTGDLRPPLLPRPAPRATPDSRASAPPSTWTPTQRRSSWRTCTAPSSPAPRSDTRCRHRSPPPSSWPPGSDPVPKHSPSHQQR